jgi:Rrf2 family nitric oxide-sensitive transcriptional repressor
MAAAAAAAPAPEPVKLTTFTDYCLRVLIYLAADPDRRATIAQIASAFGVSEHHLVKVVHFLGRQGWLRTLRGRGGGLVLARPAGEIGIGLVVRDSEGAALPAECFGPAPGSCAIAGCCRLRGVLGEAVAAFYTVLDRYTLADLVHNRAELADVLHLQRAPAPVVVAAPAVTPAACA